MKIDIVNFNFIFYKFDWMSHFASPTICLLLFYLHVSTFCFSFLFLRFSIDVSTFSFLSVQFNNSDDTKTFLPQQVVQQNYFSRPKTNIFEKAFKALASFSFEDGASYGFCIVPFEWNLVWKYVLQGQLLAFNDKKIQEMQILFLQWSNENWAAKHKFNQKKKNEKMDPRPYYDYLVIQ